MTAPLVSILVSAYNHENYIEACLRSVLEQTYQPIELIVIDDGSRDKTPDIIRQLQLQHDFIFIAKNNSGLSDTLNQALALAKGKYICQFGSDDIMLPDKTEKQVRYMEAHPDIAVTGGNALLIDSTGNPIEKRQKFPPERDITFEDIFAERGPGIFASSCMIRKDVLDREGGWDPAIPLEDMYMWFKLTSRGYRMHGFADALVYYRKHATNSYKNVRYMYESMRKTIAPYHDHPLYPEVYRNLQRKSFLSASRHDKALAREILREIPLRDFNKKVWRGLVYLLLL